MIASIRQADDADQETVLDVLTEVFANDPLASWLFPDLTERSRLQSRFYRHQLSHPGAETYLIGIGEGVSLWHVLAAGPTADEDDPGRQLAAMEDVFGKVSGSRLHALGAALAPRHPHDEPHLHLFCMGVVGGRRGAGFGSEMLRHRLRRADDDGIAAYLEASSPHSRALYLRHGFEDLCEPVQAADSPPLWPMWREPRH